jgi:hypothetical protein
LAGGPRDPDELADFRGTWTTTNCATWVVAETGLVDCGRWGDGSALTMEVGRGAMPWVTLTGASAPGCAGILRLDPAPSLDRPGTFALVALSDTDCGDIKAGPDRELQLYLEPDGDIWLDEDGDAWGLFWEQVPGTS